LGGDEEKREANPFVMGKRKPWGIMDSSAGETNPISRTKGQGGAHKKDASLHQTKHMEK